jgi:hypothetical protein
MRNWIGHIDGHHNTQMLLAYLQVVGEEEVSSEPDIDTDDLDLDLDLNLNLDSDYAGLLVSVFVNTDLTAVAHKVNLTDAHRTNIPRLEVAAALHWNLHDMTGCLSIVLYRL